MSSFSPACQQIFPWEKSPSRRAQGGRVEWGKSRPPGNELVLASSGRAGEPG